MDFEALMKCYDIGAGEQNSEVYRVILDLARKKNLSPVIGAGLSAWAYPLWSVLLLEKAKLYGCKAEVKAKMDADQYDDAAEVLEQTIGEYQLRNFMV